MHLVVIPPGGRAQPHVHVGYETGIYVLEGTVCTRWGAPARGNDDEVHGQARGAHRPAGNPEEVRKLLPREDLLLRTHGPNAWLWMVHAHDSR